MPTPDEVLAGRIVEALRGADLVLEGRADTVLERLATGNVSPQQWRQWVEEALDAGVKAEDDASN